jgi:hypothetical protein
MTNPDDELIAEAELGEEARKFLESDLGKCLIGMANQEVEAALIELETVQPNDVEAIRRLQNQAKLGRQFEQWLRELVVRGNNAITIFKHQRSQ